MTTFTRNLRLRIADTMTVDAKFNLNTLDSAYSFFTTTTAGQRFFESVNGFVFLPQGRFPGGSIYFGQEGLPIASFRVYGPANATALELQPATNVNKVTLLPAAGMTASYSLTMPAALGTGGQFMTLDESDPTKLAFVTPVFTVTDERILETILTEVDTDPAIPITIGDSLQTALGKLQGQFDSITPLAPMTPYKLLWTNANGLVVIFPDVTPDELTAAVTTAGNHQLTFISGDWQDLTADNYELVIPVADHGLGGSVHVSDILTSAGQSVMVDSISVSGTGDVTLAVPKVPDCRFTGSLIISKHALYAP